MQNHALAAKAVPSQQYFPYAPPTLVLKQETKLHESKQNDPERPISPPGQAEWERSVRSLEWAVQPLSEAERTFRHNGWHTTRERVRAALRRNLVPASRLERFDNCGAGCMVQRKAGTEQLRLSACYCHDRFCLPCASTRSRLIARNLSDFIGDSQCRHIVLTLKHSHTPLGDQFDRLVQSFAKLRRSFLWGSTVKGGGYFFECKRSACGQFFHPHLHVLVKGSYIPVRELSDAWLKVTGDSHYVHVQLVKCKTEVVNYAAKYASKPFDPSIFKRDSWLDECIAALRGRRLCGTFGEWRGRGLEDEQEPDGQWVNVGWLNALVRKSAGGCAGSRAVMERLKSGRNRGLVEETDPGGKLPVAQAS
jgi:hypothetical protein